MSRQWNVLPALAAGLVLFAVLFAAEGQAAVDVWRASTAYGHCFLVLPIALWLLWERRAVLDALPPRPNAWPVLLAIPLVAGWVGSELLGVMEGRELAVVGLFLLLLLSVLGWRLWWALSAGLLYLVFLVPFGAFVTPALQRFTAAFIVGGLDFLRIPYEADSFRIAIPEGVFYVAEACAGLRFLIASIAFGVLYAVTMFRSPWRRVAFIAVSCVVPVVANGIRGLGIVLLGHALGSAQAAAADHLIYGWVFFSAVILLLAACGLPFREDMTPAPVPRRAGAGPAPWLVWAAAVPMLLAACAGPALAFVLGHHAGAPVASRQPLLVPPPGCSIGEAAVDGPVATQAFDCPGGAIRVTTTVLPAGANPANVVTAARGPALRSLGGDVDTGILRVTGGEPANWVLLSDRESGRVAAYVLWVDGAPALGGLHDRWHLAREMFAAAAAPAMAIVATAPGEATLREFLAAQTGLAASLSAAAGAGPRR